MRLIGFAVFAVLGLAVLLSLGVWQVQRLAWKDGVLETIEARIAAEPIPLPDAPDPEDDEYLPVRAEGRTTGEELHVFGSFAGIGPGYRIIAPFETGGRRIMVDLGAVPQDDKMPFRPAQALNVAGNLLWPDETDGFTPDPDRDENIWFARDVDAMSDALGTEPLLVVAREVVPPVPGVTPVPVSTVGIPNDHLEYAITWFSLAAIWMFFAGTLTRRLMRTRESETA